MNLTAVPQRLTVAEPALTYSWARTGGTSTVNGTLDGATTATPSFTAESLTDGAEDVTHILTLTVTDSADVTATDTVTITVVSDFAAPVAIIAGEEEREVATGGTVDLDGSTSTVDRRRTPLTYAWTQSSGTGGSLADATTATPIFTANILEDGDPDVIHVFTLTVTDSANVTATDTVKITVTSGFVDPVAIIAGEEEREVATGGTVDLDGSTSTVDRRRTPLTYAWTQSSGTGGSLADATTATPIFTANILEDGDPDVIHVFTLTVTDSANVTATDTVEITVVSDFAAPVAIITGEEEREVATGGTVDLDGSTSTVDRRRTPLTYAWTQSSGTGGSLADATTATPIFTANILEDGDPDVIHVFTLTVTDSANVTATDTVKITVTSDFVDPVAIITGEEEREVATGGTVDLDGSTSTVDRRRTPLTYSWARTGGTSTVNGTLDGAITATPSFTAESLTDGAEDVTHILTLTVTDSADVTATDTVTITVVSDFAAPVAIITGEEEREVATGGTVDLDGSASTVDRRRTPLTYSWARTGGTSTVNGTLDGATTATPRFTAESLTDGAEDVTHILTLTVTDSADVTATDTVTITVVSDFAAPVAIITGEEERKVATGGTVELDGSTSTVDRRRTPLTYAWTQSSGTGGSLADATTATPIFTANILEDGDPDVIHVFTLTVTDSANVTATDTVKITVTSDFVDPVAIITGEEEREVATGGTVDLDGSTSTVDRRRTPLTYSWARTGGTSTVNGTLDGATTATPRFTAESLTDGAEDVTHILTLTVTDSADVTATDTVTITVTSDFADPVAIITGEEERKVATGGTVELDGSTSTVDRRRTPLTYAWTQSSGTGGSLADATTATPIFTANILEDGDPDVIHVFTLTVTDSANVTATDTVKITVTSDFVDPVAIITGEEEREVATGGTVDLDGSTSTVDRRRTPLTYSWARTGGTSTVNGTLDGATTATPRFTAESLTDGRKTSPISLP